MPKRAATGVDNLVLSSLGLRLAASLARATPPRLGYFLARSVAAWISSRPNSPLVAAVRRNQFIASGEKASAEDLDRAVQAVFRQSARSVYELYHYMHDLAGIERLYSLDRSFEPYASRPEFDKRGLLLAGLHMAGFDLGLRWLCRYRFKPMVLSMPAPQGGRQIELEARRAMQMNIVPFSTGALRQAVRHLQRGGMVATGIDYPVPPSGVEPCFLGHPAALSIGYVYLALRADVPVVVVASRLETDGKYRVYVSPPVEMDHYATRDEDLRLNGEKVLAVAERFIRQAPEQWLIFQPVWPAVTNPGSA